MSTHKNLSLSQFADIANVPVATVRAWLDERRIGGPMLSLGNKDVKAKPGATRYLSPATALALFISTKILIRYRRLAFDAGRRFALTRDGKPKRRLGKLYGPDFDTTLMIVGSEVIIFRSKKGRGPYDVVQHILKTRCEAATYVSLDPLVAEFERKARAYEA